MISEAHSDVSMLERLRFQSYQMLYRNVLNRLCRKVEVLGFDLLEHRHEQAAEYVGRYRWEPTLFQCKETIATSAGAMLLEQNYFVAAGRDKVVALRDPNFAYGPQLTFLSVLEGQAFVPYKGDPTEYWQTHIEPVVNEFGGNVLPGQNDVRNESDDALWLANNNSWAMTRGLRLQ